MSTEVLCTTQTAPNLQKSRKADHKNITKSSEKAIEHLFDL